MKRNTKAERTARFYALFYTLGFSFEETEILRRAEMTLHRWAELECGDGNEYGSWAIERDEATGIPYMVRHHYGHGTAKDRMTRSRVADREKGALSRVAKVMAVKPELLSYNQGDPRGCALYVVRKSDVPAGASVDSYYTRGFACSID